jgi:hypothetical protein
VQRRLEHHNSPQSPVFSPPTVTPLPLCFLSIYRLPSVDPKTSEVAIWRNLIVAITARQCLSQGIDATSYSHGFRQCIVQGQCARHTDLPWTIWQISISPGLNRSDKWLLTLWVSCELTNRLIIILTALELDTTRA